MDYQEHLMSLSVQDIKAITNLLYDNIDMSKERICSGMIEFCINLLNFDHIIPKEKALEYFA